ncbi:MAG: class I SAM-dependent methyltransferase [Burkholderiaceae bacterium]|nr:class I SAM-dependent methyltransferase [Burkholderiaceae bacterium]
MPTCAICERRIDGWLPHPDRHAISPLMDLLDVIGSDPNLHLCPVCQCNDRERHIWLYMSAVGLLQEAIDRPILHIAPERYIEQKLRTGTRSEYVAGDLAPRHPGHARLDVENLGYPDGRFHLIICNHVLEHVDDAARALCELSRCLAPDGWLVAQTPYSTLLANTMEFVSRPTPQAASLFFGQDDHVRLFGANIAELFSDAGLKGALYPHQQVLPQVDAATWGCNVREPFFLFSKTRWLMPVN